MFEAVKKGVTREQATDLLNQIKRSMRPDMTQKITQNGDWWDLSIRDSAYFTPRPGEEDDDWPDFTGEKELRRKLNPILKGLDWTYSPEEKDWITILIKAKKLSKAAAKKDLKKKTVDVVNAVGRSRYLTDESWEKKFFEFFYVELSKHKKKFITKDQYFAISQQTKFSDDDAAAEAWDLA
jgi:hypothetical protein